MEYKSTTTTMLEQQKVGRALRTVATPVPAPKVDICERLRRLHDWLEPQHAGLRNGLRSVVDAEKLYAYWENTPNLPEFADMGEGRIGRDALIQHHINAIGYSPLA
jgi:hypothetical protein